MKELIGNCYVEGNVAVGYRDEFCDKLIIPEGVTVVGENAFGEYYGLVEVVFPSTLTEIRDGAFYKCSNLRSVKLPKNVREIRGSFVGGSFWECKQMILADLSETSLTVLSDSTFFNCKKLQTISLPKTLIKIERTAIRGCTKLASLVLNDGLKIIETNFEDNRSLSILNIPNSVIHIEDLADCDHIKTVVLSKHQFDMFEEYLPSKSKILMRDEK